MLFVVYAAAVVGPVDSVRRDAQFNNNLRVGPNNLSNTAITFFDRMFDLNTR
jgi:hypothetical protein